MEEYNQNTALLVMDMQLGIVSRIPDADKLLVNVSKAIDAARSFHIPIIYLVVGFRQGGPEISANNKSFSATKKRLDSVNMDEFMTIHPGIAPLDQDITVVKRRVSAFTGSDLEVILRANDIKHLVLAGISTSGVVLSTLREAADKDYQLTVIADCCADPDEESHRILITKIFPKQADVITLEDWENV